MSDPTYRTKPNDTDRMPGGIPYIIGNEAAERFSFYGMRGILTIFMTEHLRNAAGQPDMMSDEEAKQVYHLFLASAYFFPILGSLLADIVWGKYKTILILSLGYCVGHLCIAMGDIGPAAAMLEPRNWLFLGLIFISIGSGGIKPCVSAHVGDQFGERNKGLISKTFSWFYFSINVGAATSNLLTPWLLEKPGFGPAYAFGLPGVLMALATLLFWLGRNRFVHIPPAGKEKFVQETLEPRGIRALANLAPLFLVFVPVFWALFDQTGSAWIIQAKRLDPDFMGMTWYEAQVQAVNPILILILIPTFAYLVYPAMAKFFEPTPLRKIGIGLFTAGVAFGVSGWIESRLPGGDVYSASSQANRKEWRSIHLLDGDNGSAWASTPAWPEEVDALAVGPAAPDAQEPQETTHELVIRLREYETWPIDRVVLYPLQADAEAPKPLKEIPGVDEAELNRLRSGTACRAKNVRVYAASVPKPKDDLWQELGAATLAAGDDPATIEFPSVEAGYVKLEISGNYGGAFVGLAEVEVWTGGDTPINVAALGERPNIGWQFLAYLILTASEVMVSIVCLEFAYTQAPTKMKSFIMGVYFLGVSLGNLFTAGVNKVIENSDGTTRLEGVAYYQFFTYLTFAVAVLYVVWSQFYRGQTYIQGDE